jgi:acetyl-CoA carboxylase biotin carboxyl carrier protein
MDEKEIKKIISLFKKHSFLSELEVEESGKRIRLKRGDASQPAQTEAVHQPLSHKEEAPARAARATGQTLLKIESPMVGTFYRAPSQNSKFFVEVGDTVRKGKVVCIIEAMKLMNEIESDVDGKITEILPQNGHPVEYGEPLFLLEPL